MAIETVSGKISQGRLNQLVSEIIDKLYQEALGKKEAKVINDIRRVRKGNVVNPLPGSNCVALRQRIMMDLGQPSNRHGEVSFDAEEFALAISTYGEDWCARARAHIQF